jgi:hypothetical protein
MHADGTEHRTKNRSSTTAPMLPVLDLPGALLDVGRAIVVRLHLLDEGIELPSIRPRRLRMSSPCAPRWPADGH